MFETALLTQRTRRRGSVLLSTGLHAFLCSALVFPPMLRMPELGEEPPDRMPTIVDLTAKPRVDKVPDTPPERPRVPVRRTGGRDDGVGSSARVVTVPREIPDNLPTARLFDDNVPEVVGSRPQEPTTREGIDLPPGSPEEPEVIPAGRPDVTPPVAVFTPSPDYPGGAIAARMQGVVILEAVIGRDGLVRDARVLRGLNPLLDRAATEAVLKWRYEAASIGGHPVAVYLTVTINFRITR